MLKKFLQSKSKSQDVFPTFSNPFRVSMESDQKKVKNETKVDDKEFHFVNGNPTHLYCSICSKLFTQPLKLKCGHIFCRECLLPLLHPKLGLKGRINKCPICFDNLISDETENNLTSMPNLQEEIEKLKVYCRYHKEKTLEKSVEKEGNANTDAPIEIDSITNRSAGEEMEYDGCNVELLLSEREQHEANCSHAVLICGLYDTENEGRQCQFQCKRSQMDLHKMNCDFRTQKCENDGCHRQVSLRSLNKHKNECMFKLFPCPNGCYEMISRIGLENHTYKECLISCDFDTFEAQLKLQNSLTPEQIQTLIMKKIKFQSGTINSLQKELSKYEKHYAQLDEEAFTGTYYIPKKSEKTMESDVEWLNKLAKSQKDYTEHLQTILINENHLLGTIFSSLIHFVYEQTFSAKKNLNDECLSKLARTLNHKIDVLYKCILTTWPQYRNYPDCREFLFSFAIEKLFAFIFPLFSNKYELEDKQFNAKLEALQNITPEDLQIKKEFLVEMDSLDENSSKSYVFASGAIALLKQLPEFHTIKEKSDCLMASISLICNSVMNYVTSQALDGDPIRKKELIVSADDLLPMLLYVIIKGFVTNLHSEIHFIMGFGYGENATVGQNGYCLSMFEGAVEHIMSMETTTPPPSPRFIDKSSEYSNPSPKTPEETLLPSQTPPASPRASVDMESEWRNLYGPDEPPQQILGRFTCSYSTIIKKGLLFVSKSVIFYASFRGEKLIIDFSEIFSIRKAKFGFLDNALEIVALVASDPKTVKKEDCKKVVHKFLGLDNRNTIFNLLYDIQQDLESKLEKPCLYIIEDPTIDYKSNTFDEEFTKMRDAVFGGFYDCHNEEEAILFTAIFCHVTFGDFNATKIKPGFLQKYSQKSRLVPKEWKTKINEEKVLEQYEKFCLMSETNLKCYFIKRAREIVKKMMVAYGLQVFFVKEIQDKKMKPKILGISREAILRLDLDTLEVDYQNSLEQFNRYLYQENILSLDFGIYEKECYNVYTLEGEEIAKTLSDILSLK